MAHQEILSIRRRQVVILIIPIVLHHIGNVCNVVCSLFVEYLVVGVFFAFFLLPFALA